MIQCNHFQLIYLEDIPYLIPYGAQTAQLQKSIRLNETGVFIWNKLLQERSKTQIVQDLISYYRLSIDQTPLITKDVEQCLLQLENAHAIYYDNDTTTSPISDENTFTFCIGPLTISCQSSSIPVQKYFTDFICADACPMQHITVCNDTPKTFSSAITLIHREDILIQETTNLYLVSVTDQDIHFEMQIRKDASFVQIYCKPDTDPELLFHMIRFPVLLLAQKNGLFFLHSASILFQDKAWLFSGESGAGKSTHTNLWKKLYHTPILNGDLNMLGIKEDTLVVYGQPWCGTSKIYTPKDYVVGGITFLKQASDNKCYILKNEQKILKLLHRLISPAWTQEMLKQNITFATNACKTSPVFSLECTAQDEACHVAYQTLLPFCGL